VCSGSTHACAILLREPGSSLPGRSCTPAHLSPHMSQSAVAEEAHSSLQACPGIVHCTHLNRGPALPPRVSLGDALHSEPAIGVAHMLSPARFAALCRSGVICGLYRSEDQPTPGNPAPIRILTLGQNGEVCGKCWCPFVCRFPWETNTGKSRRSHLPINERRGSNLAGCDSPHGMIVLGPCAPACSHRTSSAVMAARCEVASHLTASIAPGSIYFART
jgi:hypothetical protein